MFAQPPPQQQQQPIEVNKQSPPHPPHMFQVAPATMQHLAAAAAASQAHATAFQSTYSMAPLQHMAWLPGPNGMPQSFPNMFFDPVSTYARNPAFFTRMDVPKSVSAVPPVIINNTPINMNRQLEPLIAPRKTGLSQIYIDEAPKPSKKAKKVESDDEDDDVDSSASGSSSPGNKAKRRVRHAPGQGGKRRLKIEFLSLGEPGEDPQMCGKSGCIIPHNLRGRHEMHNQPWEFHITHEKSEGVTVVKWAVTNLSSGKTVSVTESAFQARVRQKTGNTITSAVMRLALEERVRDLEEALEKPDTVNNPIQVANIQSLIKDLRRKERNEGILFFGLRHEDVQQHLNTKKD